MTSVYTHWKITYQEDFDVVARAQHWFAELPKAMVCLHPKSKKGAAAHWHFQGVLRPGFDLPEVIRIEAAAHKARTADPKCRPVKGKKENADEKGFQYMIRYGVDSCKYHQGFTEQELNDLVSASEEYVESLQAEGYVYLKKNMKKAHDAPQQHKMAKFLIYQMYREGDKMWPPNAPKLVLYWLAKWCQDEAHLSKEMAEYISDKYF